MFPNSRYTMKKKMEKQFFGVAVDRSGILAGLMLTLILLTPLAGFATGFVASENVNRERTGYVEYTEETTATTEVTEMSTGAFRTAEATAISIGAATISTDNAEATAASTSSSPWSLETSLTFHIVNIYMLKATYRYSDRVELGIGPAYQNWKNEDQSFIGQAHAYTLVMSYRYYFWRKFNVELELWPAWNNFKSFVDNNTYRGLELWVEYKLGYRVDMGRRFNINVQPGIGHPVWMQNKWPGVDYDNHLKFILDELIFVPQVLLGYRF